MISGLVDAGDHLRAAPGAVADPELRAMSAVVGDERQLPVERHEVIDGDRRATRPRWGGEVLDTIVVLASGPIARPGDPRSPLPSPVAKYSLPPLETSDCDEK